jgi:putative transposase
VRPCVTGFSLSVSGGQAKACHTRILEKSPSWTVLTFRMDELYVRKLPHWLPADNWVFVTWRLAGSEPRYIPSKGLTDGENFLHRDEGADRAANVPIWLADRRVAQIVQDKIISLADSLYDLGAWVIMANHVHIVIPKIPLREIMHKLKGATAYAANQTLGRRGKFWKDESYDHWIRSEAELNRVIRYVERNPVKAEVVASIEHYPWCSAKGTG